VDGREEKKTPRSFFYRFAALLKLHEISQDVICHVITCVNDHVVMNCWIRRLAKTGSGPRLVV